MQMFVEHCDAFHARTEQACVNVGDRKYRRLIEYLERDTNRMIPVDLETRKVQYDKGIDQQRKVTKSEQSSCGPDVPARMNGGITVRNLQKKYDAQTKAKIVCRRTELDKLYN